MAQNDLKPNHSSSSEDEEEDEQASGSDSDEASDTDSGEKPTQESKRTVTVPPESQRAVTVPPDQSSSGFEEYSSDSDTDSDSQPKTSAGVNANAKSISSSPVERAGRVKMDGVKTVPTPPPVKSKRPPPAPTAIEKDAKKAKHNTANGETKKALQLSSQSANKAQAPDQSASETEESGSDFDSDSDPPPKKSAVADPSAKPISSKPMEQESPNLESKKAKKSESKTVSTPSPSKSKPPPQSPKTSEKDAKKVKKSTATDDDPKKQLFHRLWSEDDEIVVLQGMIDYKHEKNGEHPVANIPEFHDFIKKSLHVDVSRAQLSDKIRRLKKKYVNNAGREKDGKEISFSKSHEQKGYELSKLIWGSSETESKNRNQKNGNLKGTDASTNTVTGTAASSMMLKSNGTDHKDKIKVEVEKKLDISRFVRYGAGSDYPVLSEEMVKAGLEIVDGSKRAELEAKWMKLKEEEIVLYVKRLELLKEQALVVLEAVRSSGN